MFFEKWLSSLVAILSTILAGLKECLCCIKACLASPRECQFRCRRCWWWLIFLLILLIFIIKYCTPHYPPVITSNGGGATASVSVAENTTAVTTVTATDQDTPPQSLIYSIVTGVGDWTKFKIEPSTHALSFQTAPDFEGPTDSGGNNVYNVTVQVSDGSLADIQAIAVSVTNVNEPPVNTVPSASQTTRQVTNLGITGLSIADVDADSGSLTVTLTVTHGTLTVTGGSGSGTNSVTLNGTIASINAMLATVTYVPDANNSTDTLTMTTNDNGNTGAGGPKTDIDMVSINVSADNHPPVAVADTNSTAENATLTVNAAIGVLSNDTDPDSGDTHSVSAVNGVVGNIGSNVAGSNGGTFNIASNGSYSFAPGTAFDDLAVGQTRTTSVTYTNSDNHGDTASNTLTITVNGSNDLPVTVADTNSTAENATLTVNAASGVLSNAPTPTSLIA